MVGPCHLQSREFAFFDHRLSPFCQESARGVKIGFATISSPPFSRPREVSETRARTGQSPRVRPTNFTHRSPVSPSLQRGLEIPYPVVMGGCLEGPLGVNPLSARRFFVEVSRWRITLKIDSEETTKDD